MYNVLLKQYLVYVSSLCSHKTESFNRSLQSNPFAIFLFPTSEQKGLFHFKTS